MSVRKLNEDDSSRSDKIIVDSNTPLTSPNSSALLSGSNDKISKCLRLKRILKESYVHVDKLDAPSLDLDFPVFLK